MTFATMGARDRRALLLGLIVLAPPLLYIWGVRPYRAALDDARQQLTVERATLVRERAAIAAARKNPQLQHLADSAMRATSPRLFEGRDDVMASAELASYLGDVARARHVWLQDAATRPAELSPTGVRALKVEIRAESDLQGVLSLLQALETGTKLVRVERLDLTHQPNRSEEGGAETLALSATISGFAIPPDAASGGAAPPPPRDSASRRGSP
jgi:hypothetical protein